MWALNRITKQWIITQWICTIAHLFDSRKRHLAFIWQNKWYKSFKFRSNANFFVFFVLHSGVVERSDCIRNFHELFSSWVFMCARREKTLANMCNMVMDNHFMTIIFQFGHIPMPWYHSLTNSFWLYLIELRKFATVSFFLFPNLKQFGHFFVTSEKLLKLR